MHVTVLKQIWSNTRIMNLKGTVHPKIKFCHYLHTLLSFQTSINVFVLLNTKEDILKNVGTKQLISIVLFFHTIKANGDQQLFGYQYSSKYLQKKEIQFAVWYLKHCIHTVLLFGIHSKSNIL